MTRASGVFFAVILAAGCQVTEKKVDGETKSIEVAPAKVEVGPDTATIKVPAVHVGGPDTAKHDTVTH